MIKYKVHPIAELFPPFSDAEFKALLKDISERGQVEPIYLYEGKVLDGAHRLRACAQLNMDVKVRNYTGSDPIAFASSHNLPRRHLDESQRAMIAAKLTQLKNGKSLGANLPLKESAAQLNVSPRSVKTARQILREAPKKEIAAVVSGEKTIHAVAKEIREKKAEKEVFSDKFNRVIPDEMLSEWQRAEQTGKKLQSLAREIKSILSEGFSGAKQDRLKDVIYAEITNSAISDAEALSWLLSSVIPYALCPTCQGFNRKSCGLCKRRGWISKFLYNSPAVSKETKAIIEGK